MEDYYRILEVGEDASQDQIKKKFRKLSLQYHPDRSPGTADKFKKINEAYQILGDINKKNMYDMQRKNPFMSGGIMGGIGINPDDLDIGNLFNMLFQEPKKGAKPGGFGGFGINLNGRGPDVKIFTKGFNGINRQEKPAPIIKTVNINLEDAYKGLNYPLEIERWIIINGVKRVEKEKIYVKIPRGIDNDEIILLGEKGNILSDSLKGDVKLFIKVINNTDFIRNGINLIYKKRISLKEALTGFSFDLNHINGKNYTINNNEGNIVTPNLEKTVGNLGIVRGNQTGNLIIKFLVEFPKSLDKEKVLKLKEIL